MVFVFYLHLVYTRKISHEQKQASYRDSKEEMFTSFLHLEILGTPCTIFIVIIRCKYILNCTYYCFQCNIHVNFLILVVYK